LTPLCLANKIRLLVASEPDSYANERGEEASGVWRSRVEGLAAAIAGIGVAVVIVALVSSGDGSQVDEIDPGIPPAEFLYIDNDRVAAYLAQLQGGRATGERLSRTLTRELSGTASAGGSFEVGASAQEQSFVEREVTPTAASNYFRLFDALVETDDERIQL
jgi:hypothetical protein